jgi:large-conductance mechanosensitive channel
MKIVIETLFQDEKKALDSAYRLIDKINQRKLNAIGLGFFLAIIPFLIAIPEILFAKNNQIFSTPTHFFVIFLDTLSMNIGFPPTIAYSIAYLIIATACFALLWHFTLFNKLNVRDEEKLKELSRNPAAQEAFRKIRDLRQIIEKFNLDFSSGYTPRYLSWELSPKNKFVARYFSAKQ